jgi:hypothetical protein
MGMKMSLVFIEGITATPFYDILKEIGFSFVDFRGRTSMMEIALPNEFTLGIGTFGNCTVLAHYDLTMSIIEPEIALEEYEWKRVLDFFFINRNLLATYLLSTTNGYGFAYIENLSVKRRKIGDYEVKPIESGEPLAEEREYLNASFIDENGNRIFKVGDENYTHDQIGENIVLSLIERFTNKLSGELWEIEMEEYYVEK